MDSTVLLSVCIQLVDLLFPYYLVIFLSNNLIIAYQTNPFPIVIVSLYHSLRMVKLNRSLIHGLNIQPSPFPFSRVVFLVFYCYSNEMKCLMCSFNSHYFSIPYSLQVQSYQKMRLFLFFSRVPLLLQLVNQGIFYKIGILAVIRCIASVFEDHSLLLSVHGIHSRKCISVRVFESLAMHVYHKMHVGDVLLLTNYTIQK